MGVCRICFERPESKMYPLSGLVVNCDVSIAEMITYCTSVEIEQNDNVPSSVCMPCFRTVRIAYNFIQTFRETNKNFLAGILPPDYNDETANHEVGMENGETSKENNEEENTLEQTEIYHFKEEQLVQDEDSEKEQEEYSEREQEEYTEREQEEYAEREQEEFVVEQEDYDEYEVSEYTELQQEDIDGNQEVVNFEQEDVDLEQEEVDFHQEVDFEQEEVDLEQEKVDLEQEQVDFEQENNEYLQHNEEQFEFVEQGIQGHEIKTETEEPNATDDRIQVVLDQDIIIETTNISSPRLIKVISTQGSFESSPTSKTRRKIKTRFSCPVCPKIFFSSFENGLVPHMDKHMGQSFPCNVCKTDHLHNSDSFVNHFMKIHRFQCPYCGKSCNKKQNLCAHIKRHSGIRYECRYEGCDKNFPAIWNLRKHEATHAGKVTHTCHECGMEFTTYDTYRYHCKKHTGRKFLCPHCGRAFMQSVHLKYHMWTHTGIKKFKCDLCEKSYTSVTQLKKHRRRHHPKAKEFSRYEELKQSND